MKYDKNLCAKEGLRTITAPKQILQPNSPAEAVTMELAGTWSAPRSNDSTPLTARKITPTTSASNMKEQESPGAAGVKEPGTGSEVSVPVRMPPTEHHSTSNTESVILTRDDVNMNNENVNKIKPSEKKTAANDTSASTAATPGSATTSARARDRTRSKSRPSSPSSESRRSRFSSKERKSKF